MNIFYDPGHGLDYGLSTRALAEYSEIPKIPYTPDTPVSLLN
jgi:hypothetical protein